MSRPFFLVPYAALLFVHFPFPERVNQSHEMVYKRRRNKKEDKQVDEKSQIER